MFEIPAFFLPITCLADFLQIYAHTLSSQIVLYFIFSVSKILILFFQRSLSWLLVFNTTACSSASLLVLQCPLPVLYFLFSKIIVLSKILYHLIINYNYHLLVLSCWKHVNFTRGNLICFVPWYIPEMSSTFTKYLVKIVIQDT